jgi:hypothetical protein
MSGSGPQNGGDPESCVPPALFADVFAPFATALVNSAPNRKICAEK